MLPTLKGSSTFECRFGNHRILRQRSDAFEAAMFIAYLWYISCRASLSRGDLTWGWTLAAKTKLSSLLWFLKYPSLCYSTVGGHSRIDFLIFLHLCPALPTLLFYGFLELYQWKSIDLSLEFEPLNLTTTLWPGSMFHKDTSDHPSFIGCKQCVFVLGSLFPIHSHQGTNKPVTTF